MQSRHLALLSNSDDIVEEGDDCDLNMYLRCLVSRHVMSSCQQGTCTSPSRKNESTFEHVCSHEKFPKILRALAM